MVIMTGANGERAVGLQGNHVYDRTHAHTSEGDTASRWVIVVDKVDNCFVS